MAAELLYPWCCPGCGKLTSYKTIWCGSCINDTWNPRLVNSSVTDHLDGCYTLCDYHSGMRKCILQLKYNGKSELSKAFPPLLDRFPWWDRMEDFKIVIPVPLASRKMKERGYNQVDKMFQKWMESAGKEYFPQGLVRLRRGETQSLLTRVERYKNIKGAFHINKGMDVKGRKILLVDPCCGSGSFLLAIIRKIRIEDHGDAKTTLHRILNNVWGFDLNPLAVQTARVNYLIAIADLIKKVPGTDIEIPILLADAIYSPAPDPMMGSKFVYYEIGSHIANLQIVLPAELASDRRLLDNVFALMEKCVENNMSPNLICDALVEQGILNRDEIGSWKEALETTYSHVLSLHKRKWNGIWFRIVRNYFWSSAAGHFDVIVGNPPWVRWSKLPKLYQQRVMPTCEKYDIFAKTKYFGGNELDISGLITYTVADKWLSEGGKLIFLITQTHFQSASSSGFRKFKLDSKSYLKPLLVEDMKELKPFADAANKTALFVGIKSEDSPSYPIKYIIWKKKDGFSARIPENLSSDEVSMRTIHVDYEANPVGDLSTPWAILPKGDFKLLKKLMGTCSWIEGKKGITTDLNGVYFVKILQYSEDSRLVQIETRPEAGKTDIGPKQKFWVEPDLLYPVIKGAGQISCCGYTQLEDLAVIVPNNGILREDYLVSWEQMNKQYPHLLEYFTNFKALLANRSTYRTRMPNAPFYAVYNVGQYTFEPWKVIWAEQPGKDKFPVSVIHTQRFLGREDKVVIPDHKVYFASFPDSEHAYYLCGLLLNSTVVTYLNSFQIKVQVGDIFKHLKLPEMNSTNEMHQELISLTRMAHKEEDIFRKETLLNKISSLAGKIIF